MTTVAVFDSGVGGLSISRAIENAIPEANVIFVNDEKNVPYGSKKTNELYALVSPILKELATRVDVIVIACNTVSTTLITTLRGEIDIPIIGMEPMVKPAALATKTGVIAVCATPGTLASDRYKWLKTEFATDIKIIEPDCSDWAMLIESKQIDATHIHDQIESVCNQGADVIVLGCTHYHWIEEIIINEAKGRAKVIQPVGAVIIQLKRVIGQLS